MSTYEKPLVMVNDELAEGVYAASGDACWSVSVGFTAHADKCEVQFDCWHNHTDIPIHTSNISVTVEFNKPLTSGGNVVTETQNVGTANPNEHKVWNIQVYAADGKNSDLAITDYSWSCNG